MLRLNGLRSCREMRLGSEGELGRLVNMRAGEIGRIERGDRLVRPETAVRFSQALKVGLHDLIEAPDARAASARDIHAPSRSPHELVLYCVDRGGRRVIATLGRWEDHVEAQHPKVDGHFSAVESTIGFPDVIVRDVTHKKGENYYRKGAPPG